MVFAENYVCGVWTRGSGKPVDLFDAITGQSFGFANAEGLNMREVLQHARTAGGSALRKMTFHERGRMLRALALYLTDRKSDYYDLSYRTGATKIDSWIDIDGGIGNLFAYASLRRQFPDTPHFTDGDYARLSKQGSFIGHHILVPKEGTAIHINAFNFPVWGMLEKVAVNWLAGVPAVVKPATSTSFLAERVARDIIGSGILPEGSLQLICGSAGDLLDYLTSQDVVTFTGSASTGRKLKRHDKIIDESVPFNMEADSLNACVLGPDVEPGSANFDIFIKELRKEMTVKCGQKCTAVRRIMVPAGKEEAVVSALTNALSKTVIGDPRNETVRMGSLVSNAQRDDVRNALKELMHNNEVVYDGNKNIEIVGANSSGAFMAPVLLHNSHPLSNMACHEVEAFGPVATLMSYNTLDEAAHLVKLGKGSLVCSIITSSDTHAKNFALSAASHHGRILVLNESCALESTGHGSPMPLLVHGGPGRAGGGEEMGGKRGVFHYMQRTAIQGSPDAVTAITGVYQQGAKRPESEPHLFRKHFEEMEIGETVYTHKHTVTEADIANFANVSGDNFYAHMDATSLEGTIFERRVAHGYFVLSKAAGLFVDPKKGPVLLNYGIDEARFTKPVYPGMTLGVKLTVKEKIAQEKKGDDDIAKGIVKFWVDVFDETGETVALATILTMVKMRQQ
jgi:oxepin-CoA hydrolase/3-oxo-5,6-dehydrosuberyl-CoA semialdehyde dehydrogenase